MRWWKLDLPAPKYGHLSLITGEDGAPLSKRHGSFSVQDMRSKGFLPKALMNYLARLGHTCEEPKLLSFQELALHFHLEKLSKSPVRFDENQLKYWQKQSVHALSFETFWVWAGNLTKELVPEPEQNFFVTTIRPNVYFPEEVAIWADIFFGKEFFLNEEAKNSVRMAGNLFYTTALKLVEQNETDISRILEHLKQDLKLSGKGLFMPLRVALTGKQHGPELASIALLLGKKKMQERLNKALEYCIS